MRVDVRHYTRSGSVRMHKALSMLGLALLASCSLESSPSALGRVSLAIRTTVSAPERVAALALIDRARIRVMRPPSDVIADMSVVVAAGQSTLTAEIEVELLTPVEELVVSVELWAGDLLALAGEAAAVIDAAQPVNEGPVIVLVPVAPALEVDPLRLDYEVQVAGDPTELSFSVRNTGGAPLSWNASPSVPWLTLSPGSGTVPQGQASLVTALVDPVGLEPGGYGGVVTVSDPLALNSPQTIDVDVTVAERATIHLSVSSLSFEGQALTNPAAQVFVLDNTGGSTLNWTATSDVPWLDIAPSSGSLGPQQSLPVSVAPSTQSLEPGSYTGTITVQDPNASNSPQTLEVSVNVTELPAFELSVSSLSYTAQELSNSAAQQLTVTNVGGGTLAWTASTGASWLNVTPGSGSATSQQAVSVSVAVSTAGLGPGTYAATITFSDPNASNSPVTVSVTLTVTQRPRILHVPGTMDFFDLTPCEGDPPFPQSWSIVNDGGGTLNWRATSNASWLSVSPSSGSLNLGQSQEGSVSVSDSSLPYGTYVGTITIRDANASNSPQTIDVTLDIGCLVPASG